MMSYGDTFTSSGATESRSPLWLDVILIALSVLTIVSTFLLLPTTNLAPLHAKLQYLSIWALNAALLLTVLSLVAMRTEIAASLHKLRGNRQLQVTIIAVSLVSLLLISLPPRRNIIFWDEHIYMTVGQAISATGRAAFCEECDAEFGEFNIFQSAYNKQPPGYSFYLAIFYSLFGVSESVTFLANSASYLLGVAALALVAYKLFGSLSVMGFAAVFYAATPLVLRWAGTASAEVTSALFCSLSFAAVLIYTRRPSVWSALLAAGLTSWAFQIRAENILMLLPLGYLFVSCVGREIFKTRFYLALFIFVALQSVLFVHLYSVRYESWGSPGDKFSFAQLFLNFPVNASFLITNQRYPLLFTLFAIVGLLSPGDKSARISLLLWFAWSWGIYLFFYAGSYDFGADSRFSVICAPPLAILAARGLGSTIKGAMPYYRHSAIFLSVATLLWGVVPFLPLARAEAFEAVDARLDAAFSWKLKERVPPNAIVFSHVPALWLVRGKNAAQSYFVMTQLEHIKNNLFVRYRGGVYFHYGYWCNVPDPPENRKCQAFFDNFDTELIEEHHGRGFRYALYKLSLKTNQNSAETTQPSIPTLEMKR